MSRDSLHSAGVASEDEPETGDEGHAHGMHGAVDLVTPRRIPGWVWNSSDPATRLKVELRQSAAIVGEAEASRLRPDLRLAGIGDGRHSFVIELDQALPQGSLESVSVLAKGSS